MNYILNNDDILKIQAIKADVNARDVKHDRFYNSIIDLKKSINFICDNLLSNNQKALKYVKLHTTRGFGKLAGINSLSTSNLYNSFCLKMQKCNDECICSHCYARDSVRAYKVLDYQLILNTLLLSYTDLSDFQIKTLDYSVIFRFNSFGELNNMQELKNYYKIAKSNKNISFGLFTKNIRHLHNFFIDQKYLNNCQIVISIYKVNDITLLNNIDNYKKNLAAYINMDEATAKKHLKIFFVFDKKTAKKQNIAVNCGGLSCLACGFSCYKNNTKNNNYIRIEYKK